MNRNKYIVFLSFILICIIFCVACENKPDSKNEEKSTEMIIEVSKEEQYVTLEKAKEEINDIKGKTVNGFILPDSFMSLDADSVSVLRLQAYDSDDWDKVREVAGDVCPFFKELNDENSKIKYVDNGGFYNSIEIKSNDKRYEFAADNGGFFFCSDDETIGEDDGNIKEYYDLEWEEKSIDDEKVSSAITDVENRLNKYLSEMEDNQFNYKVQHAFVSETGFIRMIIGWVYNDTPMDVCSNFSVNYDKGYKVNVSGKYIIAYYKNDEIVYFNTGLDLLDIENEETYEKVISPKYALQLMKEEIANEGNKMGFSQVGLVYMLTQEGETKNGVDVPYNDTEIRPYWMFSTELSSSALETDSGVRYIHGNTILVDAIDGKVYYYDISGSF